MSTETGPLAMELLIRASVLLAIAGGLSWCLRHRSAGLRHLLWTSTFVFLLTLPILMSLLPSWRISLPQIPSGEPATVWVTPTQRMAAAAETPAPASELAPAPAAHERGTVFWISILWIAGTLAAWASLAASWLRFRSWVREGCEIESAEWLLDLTSLRDQLAIGRDVRLVESCHVTTPRVGGILRPVILLPKGNERWPEQRRRTVLAHELVHIRRHDVLRLVVGGMALALFWFHPLSWLAARSSLISREHACDEGVLALGSSRPSEYARHLLALADGSESQRPALSLPIVHPSQLESRILAILRSPRPAPSRPLVALLLVSIILGATATAIATPIKPVPPKRCVQVFY